MKAHRYSNKTFVSSFVSTTFLNAQEVYMLYCPGVAKKPSDEEEGWKKYT